MSALVVQMAAASSPQVDSGWEYDWKIYDHQQDSVVWVLTDALTFLLSGRTMWSKKLERSQTLCIAICVSVMSV